MATSAVTPANHESFLKKLGHIGLDCFTKVIPFVTKQAQSAEPFVDLLFPVQGGLFTTVVNSICMAEVSVGQTASAVTKAGGSGSQKMQTVVDIVGPQLLEMANQHGLVGDDADAAIKRYVQAIFDLLDGPAKASPTTPTPTC